MNLERRFSAVFGALWLVLPAGGCAGDEPDASWLDAPLSPFPASLSETGVFPDLQRPERADARALGYAPEFALWSNGSEKRRFVALPQGETIDPQDDAWAFPAGTVFVKTFSFAREADGSPRPIETRLMRRVSDAARAPDDAAWEFAAYLWDDDGRDARLLAGDESTAVEVWYEGEAFEHEVPSERQCRECHQASPAGVLGFSAQQLDYVPEAGADARGVRELERLHAAGVFDRAPRGARIEHDDDETRWVLGYVAANCAHCHNGLDGPNNAFDLRPPVFVDNTLGRDTESSASGIGVRIVEGDAEASVLFLGFTGQDNGTDIAPMPPVGVQLRDGRAAQRLQAWIEGLR